MRPEPIEPWLPTIAELVNDPSTPFFVAQFIRELDVRDPVDAANYADVVAAVFGAKCKKALGA